MNRLDATDFPLSGQQLIEASAGTGKTYTITNLYLRLLLEPQEHTGRELAVSEILVLTFTIAATEELRARIRRRITEARAAFTAGTSEDPFLQTLIDRTTDPTRARQLLSGAVQLMDEAAIYTIHGFCARVLADNAFETAMLFDQRLDADRDEMLDQAAQDCFRADILNLHPLVRPIALERWPSPAALANSLKSYLFRGSLLMEPPETPIDMDALVSEIKSLKSGWLESRFDQLIRDAGYSGNTLVVKRLDQMTAWCESDSLVPDLDTVSVWSTENLKAAKLNKGMAGIEHELTSRIDTVCDAFTAIPVNLWHQVIQQIHGYMARYKEEQAQLTLDDLLTSVNTVLTQPGGERLAGALASRWPLAMIDEFQDTDDTQWEIFSEIYRNRGQGLILIGDPKQAIYQFRGADVYTYINAKRQIDGGFSLDTNWRSTAPMIEAVNELFNQPDIFSNDSDIPFEPVAPSPRATELSFTANNEAVAPVSIVHFPAAAGNENKNKLQRLAMDWAAEETSQLLHGAERGEIRIDNSPLTAGSIAFLVRDRRDADAAREALSARGIRSVYVTNESVFLTDTADDLRFILQAALEPTNESALRAAIACPLMQSTASALDVMTHDLEAQQAALSEFSEYHRLWSELDVATMIERLMQKRRIPQKWFTLPDGERQLTNLRHLTELLQQRSAAAPGMHRLLKWFVREKQEATGAAADERQLRLESDRDLVQIVTMHAAKGLEYDVVMIPMGAFAFTGRNTPAINLYHEERQGQLKAILDLSGDNDTKTISVNEELAEEMRLLYVAITRAKYKCYIGAPELKNLGKTALARLLKIDVDDPRGAALTDQLSASWPAPLFDVASIDHCGVTSWTPDRDESNLAPPPALPFIRNEWRVHSYTGVSRMMTTSGTSDDEIETPGYADDEPAASGRSGTQVNRYSFPRGPRVGVALHTLFEDLDFVTPIAEQPLLIEHCLDRVGILEDREHWTLMMASWIDDVLSTRLGDGVALNTVSRMHRLDEMEFHFPLSAGKDWLELLTNDGYGKPGMTLRSDHLRGLMTGMIDLVFEADGKYWLVDYKSNHLGDGAAAYAADSMTEAMRHHLYDLQYLIYVVALDRYLATRLPDYDYDQHFGGVRYLFIRGMQGGDDESGVFAARPDKDFVAALGSALRGAP